MADLPACTLGALGVGSGIDPLACAALHNRATPVAHVWRIGASKQPGAGLGGGSGIHAAQALGAL